MMAYAENVRIAPAQIGGNPVERLVTAWKRYRVYRTTVNELSQLSGRDLADLGIHRSAIRSIAHEAAYGK